MYDDTRMLLTPFCMAGIALMGGAMDPSTMVAENFEFTWKQIMPKAADLNRALVYEWHCAELVDQLLSGTYDNKGKEPRRSSKEKL